MSDYQTIDLEIIAAEDKSWDLYIDSPSGVDLPLTGYQEILFTINDRWGGSRVVQKALGSGTAVITAAAGHIRISLVQTDTESLVFPRLSDRLEYVYEVRLTDASGLKFVPNGARGKFTIWKAAV